MITNKPIVSKQNSPKDENSLDALDASEWRFTDVVQTGKQRWSKLSEKFWRVPSDIKDIRYQTCKQCDQFVAATTQCKQCLCAMGIKTWLGGFACPLGHWKAEENPQK